MRALLVERARALRAATAAFKRELEATDPAAAGRLRPVLSELAGI